VVCAAEQRLFWLWWRVTHHKRVHRVGGRAFLVFFVCNATSWRGGFWGRLNETVAGRDFRRACTVHRQTQADRQGHSPSPESFERSLEWPDHFLPGSNR
jgi:hypothetical protein